MLKIKNLDVFHIHNTEFRDTAQYLQNQLCTSQGSAVALSVQLHLSVDLSATALLALILLAHILTIIPSTKPRHEFQHCVWWWTRPDFSVLSEVY